MALSARLPRLVSGGVTAGTSVVGGPKVDCGRVDLIDSIMDAPFRLSASSFDCMVASSLASPASRVASIVAMLAVVLSFKNPWYSVLANSCCALINSESSCSVSWCLWRTQSRYDMNTSSSMSWMRGVTVSVTNLSTAVITAAVTSLLMR